MERKNQLCHEQENELSDWRFKYAEFVTTQEHYKDLLYTSALNFILIDSLKKQCQ